MRNKVNVIGMVVAMDKEITPFMATAGKCFLEEKKGPFLVLGYELYGKKVYLVRSGIGEIFASAATQMLISEYKVELILNFGVCGSLHDDISVYETVVVNGVVHYDFDLSPIDGTKVGQYPDLDVVIKTNESLVDFVLSLNENIKPAICASADKFVADEKIKKKLGLERGVKLYGKIAKKQKKHVEPKKSELNSLSWSWNTSNDVCR